MPHMTLLLRLSRGVALNNAAHVGLSTAVKLIRKLSLPLHLVSGRLHAPKLQIFTRSLAVLLKQSAHGFAMLSSSPTSAAPSLCSRGFHDVLAPK